MRKQFQALAAEQIPAGVFALFRIAYGIVLLCEVEEIFRYRRLIFDPLPYLAPCEVSFAPLLCTWLVVIVLIVVGFQTRAMAIANYCFTLITFSAFSSYEYHVDYIYTATNLLLIFLPLSNRLSIDAWLRQKHSDPPLPGEVSRIYRDAVLFCSVGLVYFDSVLFKLGSPMWQSGLGVWLPASYPHATWLEGQSWLLDNRLLMLLLGYGTIMFEAAFLFLMWFRRCHNLLLVTGIVLHAGIVFIFPIPWFGFAMMAIYVLLLPESLTRRMFTDKRSQIEIGQPGRRNQYCVTAIAIASLLLQLPSMAHSPTVRLTAQFTGTANLWQRLIGPLSPYLDIGQPFLGTTPHPVFMDMHFAGYDHQLAVIYRRPDGSEQWLPLINSSGNAQRYNSGRLWVNWSFRVCGPQLNTVMVRKGVTRITAFWSYQNAIGLQDSEFRIVAREYDRPHHWERGFGERQSKKPWTSVGHLKWKENRPSFEFNNPDKSVQMAFTTESRPRP